jgi:hypothetical protein
MCTVFFLGTLFTSPSIAMGNAAMRKLSPNIRHHCMKQNRAVSQCKSGDDSNSCADLQKNAVECEKVVRLAYRHINLGGCPYEIKFVTLCEHEWCTTIADKESCRSECSSIRESLDNCITRHILNYFRKNGII